MRRALRFIPIVALAVGVVAGCRGPGTYSVTGSLGDGTITPGLWHTGGGSGCFWSRDDAQGHSIANDLSFGGPQYVEIQAGDTAFRSEGCDAWTLAGGPDDTLRTITSSGQFPGDGQFRVGVEVPPGVYLSSEPATCVWERLNSFRGADDPTTHTVIEDARSGVVTIADGDVGFASEGCGVWTKAA
jgi:hypothetical protein